MGLVRGREVTTFDANLDDLLLVLLSTGSLVFEANLDGGKAVVDVTWVELLSEGVK